MFEHNAGNVLAFATTRYKGYSFSFVPLVCSSVQCSFIHSLHYIRSCMHACMHSSIYYTHSLHAFITFIHACLPACMQSSHSSITFIHSFIRYIYACMHYISYSCMYAFLPSFTHSFSSQPASRYIHSSNSFMHTIIHSFIQCIHPLHPYCHSSIHYIRSVYSFTRYPVLHSFQ